MKITRTLPMHELRASVHSLNEEARTIELIWTTGAKGLRRGWDGPYYEELSLESKHVDLSRLNDGSHPLLAAHNDQSLDAVVGVVERAWLEGNKGLAAVRFAKDEISDRVFQKVKDKILRNVSVGYSVQNYEDVSKEGDEYPTYRATRWTPAELSIVPIGFDKEAKVRKQTTENEVVITGSESQGNPMNEPKQTAAAEIRELVREAGLSESYALDLITNGVSTLALRSQPIGAASQKAKLPLDNSLLLRAADSRGPLQEKRET